MSNERERDSQRYESDGGSASDLVAIGLHPAGACPPLGTYLIRLWQRREYILHVPRNELRARNMDTVFGNVWQLLNPMLSIFVYYLVFGLLLDTTRGVEHFIPFLAIGVLAFQYTQRSVVQSATSLSSNSGLLRSISFPRALLPVTTVATEALAFLPGIAVFVAVTLAFGVPVSASWMLLPLVLLLQTLFNVGASFITARLGHQIRDVRNLLPFVFRLLFYGSGVIFNVYAYLDDPALRWFFVLNPVFCVLAIYRWVLLGMEVELAELLSLIIWCIVLLIGGLWWFRRGEATYGH